MLIEPFLKALPILETIEEHNHQAFFVGGCVRDFLLGRTIGDVDITTSARPEMIQKYFPKVIPVGIEHGTVIVRNEDISYEVTTFRIDGDYSDKRHPDSVMFIDKIDKDLERRDFTINALAMTKDGEIIDLFDGRGDLNQKVIRTVGDGYERFKEDSLRIIRALRFSSQLGFMIHEDTLKDMKLVMQDIGSLAVERISNEFAKLFAGKYVETGISYLRTTGIYKYLPIFSEHPDMMKHIPNKITPLLSFGEVIALFHLLEPNISVKNWVKAWKCSNQIKKEAVALIQAYDYYVNNGINNWLVYSLEESYYNGFVRIVNVLQNKIVTYDDLIKVRNKLPIQSRNELDINGNDLIHMFPDNRKGPWLHKMLSAIEKEVVFDGLKNKKSEIKDWIKCHPPETN
ncbi:CCA tRNA nucleotidyltransferase [Oceanobacillus bengalensis]|uniref:CCA-adding enzyme n=2 Tax=Oceanobacillus bengalensis TaxID=1435466 RepID=A0A494YW50_9BACI|nr:CCA tRNA nucleotidyltransferase [Oceanobacillus bengalensis]